MRGETGNDRLQGGPGADFLGGGRGNDFLSGNANPDDMNGGPGTDRCQPGSPGFGNGDMRSTARANKPLRVGQLTRLLTPSSLRSRPPPERVAGLLLYLSSLQEDRGRRLGGALAGTV